MMHQPCMWRAMMHGSKICGEKRPDLNLGIPQHAISEARISKPSHATTFQICIALNCVSNQADKACHGSQEELNRNMNELRNK